MKRKHLITICLTMVTFGSVSNIFANQCSDPIIKADGKTASSSFDGKNCYFMPIPQGEKGFVWNNAYYLKPNEQCPPAPGMKVEFFDGKNCYLGGKPKNGFVWQDKYYYMKYDACSEGNNDGNNCLLSAAPDGTRAFEYNGGFYTTPLPGNICKVGKFDTKNCYLGPKPKNGFVWQDKLFYKQYDSCSRGKNDGVNCVLGQAPEGRKAFEWENKFYYTANGCAQGQFDGKNCLIGTAPKNHEAFIWNNTFYYKSAGTINQNPIHASLSPRYTDKSPNRASFYTGASVAVLPYTTDKPKIKLVRNNSKETILIAIYDPFYNKMISPEVSLAPNQETTAFNNYDINAHWGAKGPESGTFTKKTYYFPIDISWQ